MHCTPVMLLTLSMLLLLPITALRLSGAKAAEKLTRRKRDLPPLKLDVDNLQKKMRNRLAEFQARSCSSSRTKECRELQEAMEIMGLSAERPEPLPFPSPAKKECAFSLGNHCLTESLDSAATGYSYLQSGSSPGRRRRRSSSSSSSTDSALPHPPSPTGMGRVTGEEEEEEEKVEA